MIIMIITNRNDPEMIKLRREISVENAKKVAKIEMEEDNEKFRSAIANSDARTITAMLNEL
jgi:hypothetical protein